MLSKDVEGDMKNQKENAFWRFLSEKGLYKGIDVSVKNGCGSISLPRCQNKQLFRDLCADKFFPGGQLVPQHIVGRYLQGVNEFYKNIHARHFDPPLDLTEIHNADLCPVCQLLLGKASADPGFTNPFAQYYPFQSETSQNSSQIYMSAGKGK